MEIAARTEFSFREVYGPIDEVVAAGAVGIADANSWGHIFFWKECQKQNINPLLGVRFQVFPELIKERARGSEFIAYAKGYDGLPALYELVQLSEDQFYYWPRLTVDQVRDAAADVIWLGAPWDFTPDFPFWAHQHPGNASFDMICHQKWPRLATSDNFYPTVEDRDVYHMMALRGGIQRTEPMWLLGEDRLRHEFSNEAVDNGIALFAEFGVTELPQAENIHFDVKDPMKEIRKICESELKKRGFEKDKDYHQRMNHELNLIEEKGFEHYFLVIADMVSYAKKHMLVGPARGSSAGSLVCWLLGITEVDPIPNGLIFERFIDVNRSDFPDIDIDFPDDHRNKVFDYLGKKYGEKHVARLGTIMRYKPKSALTDFAKMMQIAEWEIKPVKDGMIERSGGDSRASNCLEDTLKLLDVGQDLVKKYPQIELAARIENHARQTGQHAAGIVICNDEITKFCGKGREGVSQIEKKGAEALNMLKIDALGLRTLTVLQDAAEVAGFDFLDFYSLPLDDDDALDILNTEKFAGIFQFEGPSLQSIVRTMKVKSFEDIAVITALARPGPLNSGTAGMFVDRRTGAASVTYVHELLKPITEQTEGLIVYQEQVMRCVREIGDFSWSDTSVIRKIMSDRAGEEIFRRLETQFVNGAMLKGLMKKDALKIWNSICTFGSWAFNKSHAISYGLVSYWCCWMKAHHPGAFAVGCLRHAKDSEQSLRLLRELSKEGFQYKPFDIEKSELNWSLSDDNILVGGLTNIKGIGEKSAMTIMNCRANNIELPAGIQKKIDAAETPYNELFPITDTFKPVYDSPKSYNIKSVPLVFCEDVQETGHEEAYCVIGRLVRKSVKDLNEPQEVARRGGTILKEQTTKMTFLIEDDTNTLLCSINRYNYQKTGKPLVESVAVGDTLVVRGKLLPGYSRIFFVDRWSRVDEPDDFYHMKASDPLYLER